MEAVVNLFARPVDAAPHNEHSTTWKIGLSLMTELDDMKAKRLYKIDMAMLS